MKPFLLLSPMFLFNTISCCLLGDSVARSPKTMTFLITSYSPMTYTTFLNGHNDGQLLSSAVLDLMTLLLLTSMVLMAPVVLYLDGSS